MSNSILVDRVKIAVLSSGTGPFNLGAAAASYRGVEALTDGATYSYAAAFGSLYEVGQAVYNLSTGQLIRTPQLSSNGNAAVAFPAGIDVSFTARAADLIATGGTFPIVNALGVNPDVAIAQQVATAQLNDRPTFSELLSSTASSWVGFISAGVGAVLRTVQAKLRETISVKDFGAVGDGVADDTAAIQAAINYAMLTKAWVHFPATANAYAVTGLMIGQTGANYTCHFIGDSFDPSNASQAITGQYVGQSKLRLINGSNTHLLTINPDAAQPQFHNMTFDGNGGNQTGTSHCINMADATVPGGRYLYACHMENCLVTGARNSGLFIGSGRGSGYYRNTWVQYCGVSTSDIAVAVRCYDQIFDALQVGPNTGVGMDIAGATQIQLSACVFFLNYVHLNLQSAADQVTCVNCVFDSAARDGTTFATGNAGGFGSWTFVGCTWQRNGLSANNTYSDIVADGSSRLNLVGPTFLGNFGSGNLVKYNINCVTTTQVPAVRVNSPIYEQYSGTPYVTAFTNHFECLNFAGSRSAHWSPFSGEFRLSAVCNDLEAVSITPDVFELKSAAYCDPKYITPVATNGGTTTMTGAQHNCAFLPAAGIASHLLNLPPPKGDGQIVRVSSSQAITALTVGFQAPATNVFNNVVNLPAGGSVSFLYVAGGTAWVRI